MPPLTLDNRLLDALCSHMLPQLGIRDLAKLACTCKALRRAVYAQPDLWQAGASALLPPLYPTPHAMDIAGVQQCLQRSMAIVRNLAAGRVGSVTRLQATFGGNKLISFSPDDRRIFVHDCKIASDPSFEVFDACSGELLQDLRPVIRHLVPESCGFIFPTAPRLVWRADSRHLLAGVPRDLHDSGEAWFLQLDVVAGGAQMTSVVPVAREIRARSIDIAFSRHGQHALIFPSDGETNHPAFDALVVDPLTGQKLMRVACAAGSTCSMAAWSDDGSFVMAAGHLVNVKRQTALVVPAASAGKCFKASFSPDNQLLGFTSWHADRDEPNSCPLKAMRAVVVDTATGLEKHACDGQRFDGFMGCTGWAAVKDAGLLGPHPPRTQCRLLDLNSGCLGAVLPFDTATSECLPLVLWNRFLLGHGYIRGCNGRSRRMWSLWDLSLQKQVILPHTLEAAGGMKVACMTSHGHASFAAEICSNAPGVSSRGMPICIVSLAVA